MDMRVAADASGSEDEPWTLPEGWCWTPLQRITSFIGRGRGPTYVEKNGVPVVNQKCVRWRSLETQHLRLTAREAFDRLTPELRLRRGDLLWNSTGTGTIGRAVVYDGSLKELTADSHVTIVRPVEIEPRFLGYFVETGRVQHLVEEGHVGSTNQRELPRAFVEELLFPLAPLPEQRRIVERIDALFAEIADGEAALEAARKGLETFRRALLKAAVTGELTRDWREAHKPKETGHDLLARIKVEREVTASKGRSKRAAASKPLDTSELLDLPEGWAWGTVRDVADVMGGLTKNPDREKITEKAKYLRVANVQAGKLDLTEMKEIGVTPEDRERTSLQPGDLLVVEGNGSIDQIGRCALWSGEIADCVHQNHIIKVRCADPSLLPRWCFNWLLSPHGRQEIEQVAASTSGLHTLSISKIEALPVPIPPPAEAAEILRRVSEALAAQADTVAMLEAEAADASRLRQSILKTAFEGTLVPQHPADEPAAAMLARLKSNQSVSRTRHERPARS